MSENSNVKFQISNVKFQIVNIFLCAPSVFSVPAVVNLTLYMQLKLALNS
jgi:hypothetical protein